MKNIKKLLLMTIILFMNFALIINVNANTELEQKSYLNSEMKTSFIII